MTENNFNHHQTTANHTNEHVIHSCQHKNKEEGLWEATKDATSKAWEKTKEVSGDAWKATKNFAGNVGDAITGEDDDVIEERYSERRTEYLDDEENEHLNEENRRINDEYNRMHESSKHHYSREHRQ